MRKLLLLLVAIAVIIGGAAIYLVATTPSSSRGLRFPLDDDSRALIAHVPDAAEAFALVPTAAALDAKMHANPITRGAIESWTSAQKLPRPWMLGGADLLAWRTGEGRTRYYVRLDPVRALLVRIYVMINGDIGDRFLINAPSEEPINASDRDRIVALAANLPPGDALVVQRSGAHGAFPPIARPAVSSVRIAPEEIDIVSRAAPSDTRGAPLVAQFPAGAMLTTAFTSMPRVVGDLNRLFGTDVANVFGGGGAIAVYDVESGKLLPRPRCVFIVPDDPARRAAVEKIVSFAENGAALGLRPRSVSRDGRLLFAFDDSLDIYLKDAATEGRWPDARWAAHADPDRLVPILDDLSNSLGLRIATPRLSRSARDVDRWIGALRQAKSIDAVDSDDGSAEELRVAIKSK